MLAYVFGEEPQYEVAVFLQQSIFASVATVGIRAGQMLGAIDFDGNSGRIQVARLHTPRTVCHPQMFGRPVDGAIQC